MMNKVKRIKVGLMAYHSACNFGANLQIFSTYEYLLNHGYDPVIINWIAPDLESVYFNNVAQEQIEVHKTFLDSYFNQTALCHTSEEVAKQIDEEDIKCVIVGSDAVAQHHPLLSRIHFPSKRIITVTKLSTDRMFPNPFWGDFYKYLKHDIPLVYLSASSQNSSYKLICGDLKRKMKLALSHYSYISVRDSWTQNMFSYITGDDVKNFPVTPDPVFAFNYNIVRQQKNKEDIFLKYKLPEKYILVSFINSRIVSYKWLEKFKSIAENFGYTCIAFPFPSGLLFKHPFDYEINIPLSPLDWYGLIKYASGYVGQNMHPIVVSLHNSVPFYSFDNYGITYFKCFVNKRSSKIYHILNQADFLSNHFSALNYFASVPNPNTVFDKLLYFDKKKCEKFAYFYYQKYEEMMYCICCILDNYCNFK